MNKIYKSYSKCESHASDILTVAASGILRADDIIEVIDADGDYYFTVNTDKFISKIMMIVENPDLIQHQQILHKSAFPTFPDEMKTGVSMPTMKLNLLDSDK